MYILQHLTKETESIIPQKLTQKIASLMENKILLLIKKFIIITLKKKLLQMNMIVLQYPQSRFPSDHIFINLSY